MPVSWLDAPRPRRALISLALTGVLVGSTGLGLAPLAAAADANGSTYQFTGFDGVHLMGLNLQGRTFLATYGSATGFKLAVLSKYIPVDPCRGAAASYNSLVGSNDTVGFNASLSGLAKAAPTDPCHVKVLIDSTGVIKSFQPVP